MAPRTKAKPVAERADLVEKEPTELHTDFAEWLTEQTGYEVDAKTVQLATVLRMDFQRSERNQSRLAASKEARESAEADRAKAREEREAKRAEKEQAAKDKAAAKAEGKTATKSTATKSTAATKKAAPAKKAAPSPRRRRPAAKADESL